MTDLSNAVVLITGAGGGFGREMTRQFAEEGSRLLLHDIDDAMFDGAFDSHDNVIGRIAADLGTAEGCRKLFDKVAELGPMPDVLVNNAGIAVGGRADVVPEERVELLMQLNLLSPMRLCRLFLPPMLEKGQGHLVNISSIAGWVGAAGLSSYSASKFGLRGFGESLRNDLVDLNVRVSTVYPWFSRTPILDSEFFGPGERAEIPSHLVTEPETVVKAIVKGVKRDTAEIFPDRMARRIQFLKRHIPWALKPMMRRVDKSSGSQG